MKQVLFAISDQNELIMVQNSLLIEQDNQQKREMKAKVKPDVSCNVATRGEPENLIILKLSNESHTARITNIEFDESQITFIKRTTPFELKKNERVDITGKSNSKKNISLCNWNIKVHYADMYGFPYTLVCSGTGNHKTNTETLG